MEKKLLFLKGWFRPHGVCQGLALLPGSHSCVIFSEFLYVQCERNSHHERRFSGFLVSIDAVQLSSEEGIFCCFWKPSSEESCTASMLTRNPLNLFSLENGGTPGWISLLKFCCTQSDIADS